MGKTSTSETQNTYPQWLQQFLQPLIGGSTQKMGNFQNQGWEILQGRDYKKAPTVTGTRKRSKKGGLS